MTDPWSVTNRGSSNQQLSLNISDVIDVIGQDDPGYGVMLYDGVQMNQGTAGGARSEANTSIISMGSRPDPEGSRLDPELDSKRKAYVRILEEPQPKALRFRYICEGRSAGSIPGVRSTTENKTFPGIQVMNYKGPAVVVVSCVTVDPPYRPHPHNLVGKEGCKKGVCTMTINNEAMHCIFSNLGIQCVKKRDVEDALKQREDIRVDPYQTGFGHRNQPQSIDLNALRLCFQVFLEGSEKGKFTFPLKPIVSDAIYDKKATSDLIICKLSDCTSSVAGGKEIILLCDKVTKEDIHVRFYEVKDGMIEWEAFGDFQASDVHKQVAISFKTPRYKTLEIENPIKVFVQLLRPSDKSTSEPRPFQYLPLDSDPGYLKRKMAKLANAANTEKFGRYLAENQVYPGRGISVAGTGAVPRPIRHPSRPGRLSDKIKMEPVDMIGSPVSPGGGQLSPAPPGVLTGHVVKPPVSPIHLGGGTMITTSPPGPSPGQQTLPVYYHQQSPGQPPNMTLGTSPGSASARVPSPYHPYYQSCDPYSPEAPAGPSMHVQVAAETGVPAFQSQLLDLDSHHINHHPNPIELDINNINSAELFHPSENDINVSMVEAHLSESLSSTLNIIDQPTNLNKLNWNSRTVSGATAMSYVQNIPHMPSQTKEQCSTPSGSDSFNNIKNEIALLNELASKQ